MQDYWIFFFFSARLLKGKTNESFYHENVLNLTYEVFETILTRKFNKIYQNICVEIL